MAKKLEENKKEQEKERNKRIAIIVAVVVLLLIILLLLFLIRKEYTVTFDSNGGSEVVAVKVKENDKVEKPEDPTREGYVFGGWYYDKKLYDFDTPVKQDMTLEAEWAVEGSTANAVTGVKLNAESVSLGINGADTLVATITPSNATNPKVTWKSSDKSIVTVDENGNIKGLKAGKATITVTTEDGGFTATCKVTVTEEKAKDVEVTGVKISGANTVTVGSTIKLTATVSPSNATNKKVTWSSNHTSVATVDSNGNVKGVKAGTVKITAKTANGKTATYTVTVKAKPTSTPKPTTTQKPTSAPEPTTQNPTSNPTPTPTPSQSTVKVTGVKITGGKDIYVGESVTLTAVITPSNATNKKVTWKSSNNSVATVDSNGKVTGVSEGEAVITVTTEDGNKTASITIKVIKKVEKLTYELEWVEIDGSSVAQTTLYIKASNGKYVSGKVELTLLTGKKITIDVSTSGNSTYPKKIVKDAVIKSVG